MATHSDNEDSLTHDTSSPFKGLVLCCTSIPPEQRSRIAAKVSELGGIHKYDLTPDCTHLIVGDYDTPKYRHVARERLDIKAMDALWVEQVMDLWKRAEPIPFAKLEKEHELRPLETCGVMEPSSQEGMESQEGVKPTRGSLLICLTGFGEDRAEIEKMVWDKGGRYTGDLNMNCTHLVVRVPEGQKFAAAKQWGIHTVTLDWLTQSVERGMILEEPKFDPLLPPEEQGVGAWTKDHPRRSSLGKRTRSEGSSAVEGSRKLRKTASMKLNSQNDQMWTDLLDRSKSGKKTQVASKQPEVIVQDSTTTEPSNADPFSLCVFASHGFPQDRKQILDETVLALGGSVAASLGDLSVPTQDSGASFAYRFLIVPQKSQAQSHPQVDDQVHVVTEFYIERCLHHKSFLHPDDSALGRPFPQFPIEGFSSLTICTAAFTKLELNHVAKSIAQLGAQFDARFHKGISVLVARSLQAMRKEKLTHAIKWGIPIVQAEWLWECISTGFNVPIEGYVFPEIKGKYSPGDLHKSRQHNHPPSPHKDPKARPRTAGRIDTSGFDRSPRKAAKHNSKQDSMNTSAEFMTARSHRDKSHSQSDAPLSEMSAAVLNGSPSPTKRSHASPTGKVPQKSTRSDSTKQSHEANQENNAAAEGTEAIEQREAEMRAEAQAKAEKAQERAVLSSKITSLIDHSSSLDAGRSSSAPHPGARPRKRQILGRALSNASTEITPSTEDAAATAAMASGNRFAPSRVLSLDDAMLTAAGSRHLQGSHPPGGETSDAEEGANPPATQLEYHDPGAVQAKERLMRQMMGSGGDESSLHAEKASVLQKGSSHLDDGATKAMTAGGGPRVLRRR